MNSKFNAKKFSSVMGALKKGYALDSVLGGFPVVQVLNAPAAADANGVLAATALAASGQTITAGITAPDAPRNLSVTGNGAAVYGTVTILGRDHGDYLVSEDIVASGTATVVGNYAFAKVDSILLPIQTTSGQTISVGLGGKLGLYRPYADTVSGLDYLEVDGSVGGITTVDTDNGTFTPATAPNGSHVYKAYYQVDFL